MIPLSRMRRHILYACSGSSRGFVLPQIQNLSSAPKEALHGELFALHAWSGYALYALVILHIVGALKHQFINRHAELQRMGLG
jgi:cytochrome b561